MVIIFTPVLSHSVCELEAALSKRTYKPKKLLFPVSISKSISICCVCMSVCVCIHMFVGVCLHVYVFICVCLFM